MRGIAWVILLLLIAGCASDELSQIAIRNMTDVPIYALPYSSDFTDGEWIEPGFARDFYSIESDHLDGFGFFSFYYDSLIVYLRDHDDNPVKFYKDGSTINYDPTLNPFLNPDVWESREIKQSVRGTSVTELEEKRIFEHYFCIEAEKVKSLEDTVLHELNPAL
jgi:hypothetical protein